MNVRAWLVVVTLSPLAVACGGDDPEVELPNPAAVYCEEQGGTVSGPEPMCTLPDGTVVDAWELYRDSGELSPDG